MQCQVAVTQKPYDFRERSFLFACDVVAFARIVADRGYILARLASQLVDAGGSIGANLEESASGQSRPDFISKQCIALKESREARFWLRLIAASEPPLAPRAQPLIVEASEFVADAHCVSKNRALEREAQGSDVSRSLFAVETPWHSVLLPFNS